MGLESVLENQTTLNDSYFPVSSGQRINEMGLLLHVSIDLILGLNSLAPRSISADGI